MAQARLGKNSENRGKIMQGDSLEQGSRNMLSKEPLNDEHDEVSLPPSFRCSSNNIDGLLDHVYHTIDIAHPDRYFEKRCVLAPREYEVDQINDIMLERLPGDLCQFGAVTGGLCYPEDQLPLDSSFLMLKLGCPVILTRTGCRGVVSRLGGPYLLIRMFSGRVVSVRRTPVSSLQGLVLLQFPVKLAFAMTIEEAQGETFSTLGIDLRCPPSRHQLLLALSTGIDPAGVKCIGSTNMEESQTKKVHREVVVCHT